MPSIPPVALIAGGSPAEIPCGISAGMVIARGPLAITAETCTAELAASTCFTFTSCSLAARKGT